MTLQSIIYDIRNKIHNNYPESNIRSEYKDFSESNPKLFEMILNPSCDAFMLEKLIECYNLRSTTDHNKVDEQFGTYAVRKYITKK